MVAELRAYPHEALAAQPIGYWSGETYRRVVGRIRADLATEGLTQPHWWILNHVAGEAARWDRATLTHRLAPFDDLDIDFDGVIDDLLDRGWMTRTQAETFVLTEAGEAGRTRAADRAHRAQAQLHDGIASHEYVAALNVLRRMIANLGGDADLP
ncbi:winged helix-turn-helix transcriptional regulator [Frankia sp. AgB1.9]|uniref:MarR family winged helix-turn-helix transcriptional regulator n=1 Tax=unclassified Frankia TaxID=2632575 RepID=UPI001933AE65|nr:MULTISPECIES: MarR family winged helix-turn-helix transcriptional regulator [unclassified Frankia]MBL7492997.1 winged helix-turn-helix transcriptional regulator [Frankia sp. AgW1.1]MBL7549601.1 winged helix-turn-helix transcriptional regulator [Frankia sp. AgB1.9]MBL7620418.1 winged helix-turn-helix transcriptional regulator [Frankia sp. AgB1.8]